MDEFKVENGAILKEQIKEEDTESESDGEQVSASDHKVRKNFSHVKFLSVIFYNPLITTCVCRSRVTRIFKT